MNSKDEKQPAGVYLGPSFYGIIQKGTVLRGGHSSKMAQLMGAYPFLRGLIVPTSQLAEKRMELRKQDSELFMLYQKAEQIKEEKHV